MFTMDLWLLSDINLIINHSFEGFVRPHLWLSFFFQAWMPLASVNQLMPMQLLCLGSQLIGQPLHSTNVFAEVIWLVRFLSRLGNWLPRLTHILKPATCRGRPSWVLESAHGWRNRFCSTSHNTGDALVVPPVSVPASISLIRWTHWKPSFAENFSEIPRSWCSN